MKTNGLFTAIFSIVLTLGAACMAHAENNYDIGTPTLKDIYIDPQHGSDANDGSTPALALQSLNAAWGNILQTGLNFTTTGYRFMLQPGVYTSDNSPSGYNGVHGTMNYPLVFQAASKSGVVILPTTIVSGSSYVYFMNVTIAASGPGDVLTISGSDHILVRGCNINASKYDTIGKTFYYAPNAINVGIAQYCYIENCSIHLPSSAFVQLAGVQYGHVLHTTMDSSSGEGLIVGEGSAYLSFEANTITNVVGPGFDLGHISYLDDGFTLPWVHYDIYDLRIDNNVIAGTGGEALICGGGYDVLFAFNTMYRTGLAAPTLFHVALGRRTCDQDQQTCLVLIDSGAWGTVHQYHTDVDAAWIPNDHLYIYNNVFEDPTGFQTLTGELTVDGPDSARAYAHCPKPAYADNDLQIKGNVIFNGSLTKPLGLNDSSGAQPSNPTCNQTLILANNAINIQEPVFVNAAAGDLHPVTGSFLFSATAYPIPDFTWSDLPGNPFEPQGSLSNSITTDFDGKTRNTADPTPGSFGSSTSGVTAAVPDELSFGIPMPNPASDETSISVTTNSYSPVSIGVYDLLGREVVSVEHSSLDAGSYHYTIPVHSLENGVYYIRILCGGQSVTRQIIVMH